MAIITNIFAFTTFVSNDLNNPFFLSSFIVVFTMLIVHIINLMIVFVAKNVMIIGISAIITAIITLIVIPFPMGLIIFAILLTGGFFATKERLGII